MPVTKSDAMHLLRRCGMTLTNAEVTPLLNLERDQLVNWVFDFSVNPAVTAEPVDRSWGALQTMRTYWLDRMITAPRPLQERITLFWHNHFATANRKVGDAVLMWNQNKVLRNFGLGDFNVLAKAVSLDPAMLLWLDGAWSSKWGPNENFSRELLELFMVGANNGYTESDVRELAKAWTGHSVFEDANGKTVGYQFRADRHDETVKTIFGVSANWDGPQVLDAMILSGGSLSTMRPLVAKHIAKKLWTWFAAPNPDSALLDKLAGMLASTSGMNIESFLRKMFQMDEFYTDAVKNGLVRDPLSWFVAIHKAAGLTLTGSGLAWFIDQLAMVPFDPPNVAGWKGGQSWISASAFWRRAEGSWNLFSTAQRAVADGGSSFLNGMETQNATDVVGKVLDMFGENRIATGSPTWNALVGLVELDRTNVGWAQKQNLARTLALSPEFATA